MGIVNDDDREQQQKQCYSGILLQRNAIAYALVVSLNALLLGYDMGAMSGAILIIQDEFKISQLEAQALVGSLSMATSVGSLLSGKSVEAIGAKWTLAAAALTVQIGGAITTTSPSFAPLLLGRLISGIGFGLSLSTIVVGVFYITDLISPYKSLTYALISLGTVLGQASVYAFSRLPPDIGWRAMLGLGLGVLPSAVVASALLLLPADEFSTTGDEVEVSEIKSKRRCLIDTGARVSKDCNRRRTAAAARMLAVGFGIQFFEQITGVDSLFYHIVEIAVKIKCENPTITTTTTNSPLLISGTGIIRSVFACIGVFLVLHNVTERRRRRSLLCSSTVGMAICMCCLTAATLLTEVADDTKEEGRQAATAVAATVLSVWGAVAFFSVGIGPISWVLSSEMIYNSAGAHVSPFWSSGNRLWSGAVCLLFPSVVEAVTLPGAFFILCLLSALSALFVYAFVPNEDTAADQVMAKLEDQDL